MKHIVSLLSITAILFMAFPTVSHAYSIADYIRKTEHRDGSNFCTRFDEDKNGGSVRVVVYSRIRTHQPGLTDEDINRRALIQMEYISHSRGLARAFSLETKSFKGNLSFAYCRLGGFITRSKIRRLIEHNIPFDPTLGQNFIDI